MFLGRPLDFTEKILAAITVDAPASQYGWRGGCRASEPRIE